MLHERRSGQRRAVLLSVELSLADGARRVCRAYNVVPEGMLLENNGSLLKIGTSLALQVGWREQSWTISATVTHCNSHCMGVMFSQRQSEFYRTVTRSNQGRSGLISEKETPTSGIS